MERLGLRYDDIKEEVPHLVYAQITAWGMVGRDMNLPGYDIGSFWGATGLYVCSLRERWLFLLFFLAPCSSFFLSSFFFPLNEDNARVCSGPSIARTHARTRARTQTHTAFSLHAGAPLLRRARFAHTYVYVYLQNRALTCNIFKIQKPGNDPPHTHTHTQTRTHNCAERFLLCCCFFI